VARLDHEGGVRAQLKGVSLPVAIVDEHLQGAFRRRAREGESACGNQRQGDEDARDDGRAVVPYAV
jgi:hypothetical protein